MLLDNNPLDLYCTDTPTPVNHPLSVDSLVRCFECRYRPPRVPHLNTVHSLGDCCLNNSSVNQNKTVCILLTYYVNLKAPCRGRSYAGRHCCEFNATECWWNGINAHWAPTWECYKCSTISPGSINGCPGHLWQGKAGNLSMSSPISAGWAPLWDITHHVKLVRAAGRRERSKEFKSAFPSLLKATSLWRCLFSWLPSGRAHSTHRPPQTENSSVQSVPEAYKMQQMLFFNAKTGVG